MDEFAYNCLKEDLVFGIFKEMYKNVKVTDFEKKRERNAIKWLILDNSNNIDNINDISSIRNERNKDFEQYKDKTLKIIKLARKILSNETFTSPTITNEQCKELLEKYNL